MARYSFENGYGLSVIRSEYSYGGSDGLFEAAVLYDDHIVYDTPITSDVLGWQTQDDIVDLIALVEALPPRKANP
jgi:hypothetical protein